MYPICCIVDSLKQKRNILFQGCADSERQLNGQTSVTAVSASRMLFARWTLVHELETTDDKL